MIQKCCLCEKTELTFKGSVGVKPGSVLSDLRTIERPSQIYQCAHCGHWQKSHNADDWKIIGETYANYKGHALSGGEEQLVFLPGLPPRARSFHAFEQCLSYLPSQGKLLDFGCGDGAVLKSASKLLQNWTLDAYDISDHFKKTLLEIPRVQNFFSKNSEPLPQKKYDLVVLWHSLEHVPEPTEELRKFRHLVSEQGMLLIQVPDISRNSYDLGVFDHVSHFTRSHLLECANRAGWELVLDGWDWTHNCLTVLLKLNPKGEVNTPIFQNENILEGLNSRIQHINHSLEDGEFAVWGTGIASLLTFSHFLRPPVCFIDDDVARHGRDVCGVPICSPGSVNSIFAVVLPFPIDVAKRIQDKTMIHHSSFQKVKWIL